MADSKFGLMILYQCNWDNVEVIILVVFWPGKVADLGRIGGKRRHLNLRNLRGN